MGYHLNNIEKGVLGEFSKIEEEFYEFFDACEQKSTVMQIIELSDIIGAIEHYYKKQGNNDFYNVHSLFVKRGVLPSIKTKTAQELYVDFQIFIKTKDIEGFIDSICSFISKYNLTYNDLYLFNSITQRAFLDGSRGKN